MSIGDPGYLTVVVVKMIPGDLARQLASKFSNVFLLNLLCITSFKYLLCSVFVYASRFLGIKSGQRLIVFSKLLYLLTRSRPTDFGTR